MKWWRTFVILRNIRKQEIGAAFVILTSNVIGIKRNREFRKLSRSLSYWSIRVLGPLAAFLTTCCRKKINKIDVRWNIYCFDCREHEELEALYTNKLQGPLSAVRFQWQHLAKWCMKLWWQTLQSPEEKSWGIQGGRRRSIGGPLTEQQFSPQNKKINLKNFF